MVDLYFGSDTLKVRQSAHEQVETYQTAGFRLEKIESVLSAGLIASMAGSVSLFGEKTVFLVDTPSEDEESKEIFWSAVGDLSSSENAIVVIENTLLAPEKKKAEKFEAKLFEFIKQDKEQKFDPFAINNALIAKDKRLLWVLLQEARLQGIPSEETIGIIWWQLKSLRLAAITQSAEEAGMKSYPYDKAKRALRNFKTGEVEKLSRDLLRVYHEGHGGVKDIEIGLEEWVLGV